MGRRVHVTLGKPPLRGQASHVSQWEGVHASETWRHFVKCSWGALGRTCRAALALPLLRGAAACTHTPHARC